MPWTIILCVDQSGSMLNSLIHATVMASILAGLPAVEVRFVAFDTSIVDMSDKLADPVDLCSPFSLAVAPILRAR